MIGLFGRATYYDKAIASRFVTLTVETVHRALPLNDGMALANVLNH